jgi:hypothetical protein
MKSEPKKKLPRRDLCSLVGKRAQLLDPRQAAAAWYHLSGELEAMEIMEMPKFKTVLRSIRSATIKARSIPANPIEQIQITPPSPDVLSIWKKCLGP